MPRQRVNPYTKADGLIFYFEHPNVSQPDVIRKYMGTSSGGGSLKGWYDDPEVRARVCQIKGWTYEELKDMYEERVKIGRERGRGPSQKSMHLIFRLN